MNCSTCINRHSPYKNCWCRTMAKPPEEKFCHRTREQALNIEQGLMNTTDRNAMDEAKKQIKWLNGLEG